MGMEFLEQTSHTKPMIPRDKSLLWGTQNAQDHRQTCTYTRALLPNLSTKPGGFHVGTITHVHVRASTDAAQARAQRSHHASVTAGHRRDGPSSLAAASESDGTPEAPSRLHPPAGRRARRVGGAREHASAQGRVAGARQPRLRRARRHAAAQRLRRRCAGQTAGLAGATRV